MLELVTGGSGSGKSAYAEEHICRIHRILSRKVGRKLPLFYIAAMIPRGEETLGKIERHRKMRETRGFQTLEWYTDIAGKIREKSLPVLQSFWGWERVLLHRQTIGCLHFCIAWIGFPNGQKRNICVRR